MECKYCRTSFRLTEWNKDPHACPDCDGITDDLSIDDSALKVDLWHLRHPSGKTEPVFEYDRETDDI